MRNSVFVVGCPRSATSEFAHLLNSHDDIFIGLERYLHLYPEMQALGPKLSFDATRFLPENFARIEPGETFYQNIDEMKGWASGFYGGRGGAEKLGRATVVGDKAPVGLFYVEDIASRLSGSKFLIVMRDIISVSRSWERRANDPGDVLWPRTDGFAAAVSLWIDYMAHGLMLRRSKIPILEVFSPNLYSDNDMQVNAVLRFLGLEQDDAFRLAFAERKEWVKLENFRASPTAEEKKVILSHVEKIKNLVLLWRGLPHPCRFEDLFWEGFLGEAGIT